MELYNVCFSAELLHWELAWTREDPLLGYLLWTGPLSMDQRGMLTTTLDSQVLRDCKVHLDALNRLRFWPLALHRSDIIGHLTLILGHLARAVAADHDSLQKPKGVTPTAVVQAMRLLDTNISLHWTLKEVADRLHLSPGYLVRLFKSSTGMPPMAYLARRRLETAAGMLLRTDQPVTQIARTVGWPDQNYFARRFKAHFGLSATSYRSRFADNARQLRTWSSADRLAPDRSATLADTQAWPGQVTPDPSPRSDPPTSAR